jgi:predicted RNase H-like HicB family nuclease
MNGKFLVVIEKGENNYSAYSPDVPGCVVTAKTVEEIISNMKEALEFHIEGMLEDGESFPMPKTLNYYIENTDEISSDDILTHIKVKITEMALA